MGAYKADQPAQSIPKMNTNNVIQFSIAAAIAAAIASVAALVGTLKLSASSFPVLAAAIGYLTVVALIAMVTGDYRKIGRSY